MNLLYFQFSLWDSTSSTTTTSTKWTFNSLYEILLNFSTSSADSGAFQFSLWDSDSNLSLLGGKVWLSILFMRFVTHSKEGWGWNNTSFNSLYEILNNYIFIKLKKNKLSILFMRFVQNSSGQSLNGPSSFNSLYEILIVLLTYCLTIFCLSILFMRF